jgi:hypothetical protein
MGRIHARVWLGVLLVAGGVLFLLQNTGLIPQAAELFWALVFGLAGIIFLVAFAASAGNWWAAIPGFVLLALAALMIYGALLPDVGQDMGGSIFLAGISLGFWAVLLRVPSHWWAAIPGGVLATLAVVASLDAFGRSSWAGSVFFYGLGLTFVLLMLLPTVPGRRRWPVYPAVVLMAIGLSLSLPGQEFLRVAWPIVLILFGAYLLIRRRPREAPPERPDVQGAPSTPSAPGSGEEK